MKLSARRTIVAAGPTPSAFIPPCKRFKKEQVPLVFLPLGAPTKDGQQQGLLFVDKLKKPNTKPEPKARTGPLGPPFAESAL